MVFTIHHCTGQRVRQPRHAATDGAGVFPIVDSLGIDPVWFGIVIIIVVEIGLIMPPIGMNVFMVKTVLKDVGIWTIFNGVWPFLIATLIGLSLILIFPGVALMLPNLILNLRN